MKADFLEHPVYKVVDQSNFFLIFSLMASFAVSSFSYDMNIIARI